MFDEFLAGLLGWAVFDRVKLRRARGRLEREAVVACAIRGPEGEVSGVGPKWLRGRALLQPGRLVFSGERRLDDRDLDVLRLDRMHQRSARGREAWQDVSPDESIVRVITPGGVIELALLRGLLDDVTRLLAVS